MTNLSLGHCIIHKINDKEYQVKVRYCADPCLSLQLFVNGGCRIVVTYAALINELKESAM